MREIQLMLRDVVNNQLTVIMASAAAKEEKRIARITGSVTRISELVDTLSDESISNWKRKYSKTIESLRA